MIKLSPIPHSPIEEGFLWREWLFKVQVMLSSGASGSFKSADATPKTITVVNGIITSIV
jgi:hypothetical protein